MPKSKRDKQIALTKTNKKNLLHKQTLTTTVRAGATKYEFAYVFHVANMRNSQMKAVRDQWGESRFLMGKTRVMKFGLGQSPETECETNLHELSECLNSGSGLLFTDRPPHQVIEWFNNYKEDEFARAGNIASKTVTLPAGPLLQFSFAMETHLRSLGLPTRLERAVVVLDAEYTVCTRGDVLKPNQTKLLKLLGVKLARFRLSIKASWSKSTKEVTHYEPSEDKGQETEEAMDASSDSSSTGEDHEG